MERAGRPLLLVGWPQPLEKSSLLISPRLLLACAHRRAYYPVPFAVRFGASKRASRERMLLLLLLLANSNERFIHVGGKKILFLFASLNAAQGYYQLGRLVRLSVCTSTNHEERLSLSLSPSLGLRADTQLQWTRRRDDTDTSCLCCWLWMHTIPESLS